MMSEYCGRGLAREEEREGEREAWLAVWPSPMWMGEGDAE